MLQISATMSNDPEIVVKTARAAFNSGITTEYTFRLAQLRGKLHFCLNWECWELKNFPPVFYWNIQILENLEIQENVAHDPEKLGIKK